MPSVRITAGRYKNRVLTYKPGPHLRPTTHKTRQTVFNILNHRFFRPQDLDVLDAFAGLGAYGYEALSLGARHVTFVEENPSSAGCLYDFSCQLKVQDQVKVIQGALPECFEKLGTYDLIFMDPPYAWPKESLQALLDMLRTRALKKEGLLIFEGPRILDEPLLARKSGSTFVSFYDEKESAQASLFYS